MPDTITLPRIPNLEGVIGYDAFVSDLQTTYSLQSLPPDSLKWVGVAETSVDTTPKIVVEPEYDTAHLSINLHPVNNGEDVTGTFAYHAPLLMRDVGRWGISDLRRFKVTKWRGRPEHETFFTKKDAYALHDFVEGFQLGLQDTTPVVDVIGLLPISPDGSYQTEFAPEISFSPNAHNQYRVLTVMDGAAGAYSALTRGRREIKDIDETQREFNWKADFVPDMSYMENLLLPDSAGHMILIASPIEMQPDFSELKEWYGRDEGLGGAQFRSFGLSRGATIGRIGISQGTQTGQGDLFRGELSAAASGKTIMYHIRFLGVKPDVAGQIDSQGLSAIGGTLDAYLRS